MILTTLLDTTIDRIGDWNPQLFRELKGRFTARSLLITAVFVTALYGGIKFLWITKPRRYISIYSGYCQVPPNQDTTTIPALCPEPWINQTLWWMHTNQRIFLWIAVVTMFLAICGGMLLVIYDLAKEKRQKTLNFILFSPQPTRTLVWGKILGVPSVLYGAIAISIPFHLQFALQGGLGINVVIGFYLALASLTAVFLHLIVLVTTYSKTRSDAETWLIISGAILFLINLIPTHNLGLFSWLKLFSPSFILSLALDHQTLAHPPLSMHSLPIPRGSWANGTWFGLPIGSSVFLWTGLILLNAAFCLYWCDRALLRRFRNPTATLWTKVQAYRILGGLNVIWFGFYGPFFPQDPETLMANLVCWMVYMVGLMVIFMGATYPQRQTLIDWARDRYPHPHRRALLWDLLIDERSPNILIIVIMGLLIMLVSVIGASLSSTGTPQDDWIAALGVLAAWITITLWFVTYTLFSSYALLQVKPIKRLQVVNFLALIMTSPFAIAITVYIPSGFFSIALGAMVGASSDDLFGFSYGVVVISAEVLLCYMGAKLLRNQLHCWGRSQPGAIAPA